MPAGPAIGPRLPAGAVCRRAPRHGRAGSLHLCRRGRVDPRQAGAGRRGRPAGADRRARVGGTAGRGRGVGAFALSAGAVFVLQPCHAGCPAARAGAAGRRGAAVRGGVFGNGGRAAGTAAVCAGAVHGLGRRGLGGRVCPLLLFFARELARLVRACGKGAPYGTYA